MQSDFKTLTFPNTQAGQEQKIQSLRAHAEQGWKIETETITGDFYDVDSAVKEGICLCLACAPICAPFAFLGKQSKGIITVTLSRSDEARMEYEQRQRELEQVRVQRDAAALQAATAQRNQRLSWLKSLPQERFPSIDGNYRENNLFKAIYDYISRHPSGELPDLGKCSRDSQGIILRDREENVLAKYRYDDLRKLPAVEL